MVKVKQNLNLPFQGGALMKVILAKDKCMKQELSEVYQALLKFVKLGILTDDIKAIVAKLYGDYVKTLEKYDSELVNDECPIVVAGIKSYHKCSCKYNSLSVIGVAVITALA